jgi:hypothetical protein
LIGSAAAANEAENATARATSSPVNVFIPSPLLRMIDAGALSSNPRAIRNPQ